MWALVVSISKQQLFRATSVPAATESAIRYKVITLHDQRQNKRLAKPFIDSNMLILCVHVAGNLIEGHHNYFELNLPTELKGTPKRRSS